MLWCLAVSFILTLMAKLPLRDEHKTVSEPYPKCCDCMYHKNMYCMYNQTLSAYFPAPLTLNEI